MGFTIEDMMITSNEQYHMKMIAGKNGWSNSINWVLMIEDTAILSNFSGKELAVTTGLGFDTEDKLLVLAERLTKKHASGLMLNTGEYILKVPESLIEYCDENDLPLIVVPWEVYLADMIKDLSIRIFMQEAADEQIANAVISAIESPDNQDAYRKELLPYYDVDGNFQLVLFTMTGLDQMDTVDRKKLSHRLEIYLENITHNGNFFYYDGDFVLMVNDVTQQELDDILSGMIKRTKKRMPEVDIYVGVGSLIKDISQIHISYQRAKAALKMSVRRNDLNVKFDDMGLYRILYLISDSALLKEMEFDTLKPLIDYDEAHNGNYVETLELYLKYNGSIQAVAEEMFTHRNTVVYRMANIKKMINSELDTEEEKLKYQIALHIRKM